MRATALGVIGSHDCRQAFLTLLWAVAFLGLGQAYSQDPPEPKYLLAYRFAADTTVRHKVAQYVKVETTIKGVTQVATTRSISTKVWRITEVTPDGKITLTHSVEDVDMWQSVTGRKEEHYNSRTDKTAPPGHELVAASIGKPLATVTIDKHGRILTRKDEVKQFNPGIGELTIPLPLEPVKVGDRWRLPNEVQVRIDGGQVKRIATQQSYTLEKVSAGVATIAVDTQILTPLNDPKIKSQLVQRLQRGTIKFDLDTGRLIHKQLELNEAVLGFNGPESNMDYAARFTEEPLAPGETAGPAPPAAGEAQQAQKAGPDLK